MTDRLDALLGNFSVRATVRNTGTICGTHELAAEDGVGQLHLVRRGTVVVHHAVGKPITIDTPSLLLYPRPCGHRFVVEGEDGADLACAALVFESGTENPLVSALPACLCLPLDQLMGARLLLDLLFEEAFEQRCGRREVLGRLFELVLIQVLRHQMGSEQLQTGLMAGLAHPRLRRTITAMHERPREEWTLEASAAVAGMSRSSFAQTFRTTVGCTPGEYLQRWRILLVQKGLRGGKPLKLLVDDAGYASESALSRAFKAQVGVTPREWRGRNHVQRRPD
ncbi:MULTISPECIES: AraC family transcriptional regulator [unclassified Lysobacter]|uniref:AraC family transcriptional regulator n=1 Tax=unclassified Lysobacter TaxID=2635362 RepID=UPI001C214F64|nr:AraC family transcriptional regulator [Lysobacter sp. MMG2]MBU8975766.1 AraC family transcriptional regulator [Lysobacter sp. MMG2]